VRAIHAIDAALFDELRPGEALLVVTNRGTQRYVMAALAEVERRGQLWAKVSGVGVAGAELTTVDLEMTATITASHLAALLRLAQLAVSLGAPFGPSLEHVPDAVEVALAREREPVAPPSRQLDFAGSGINQWVALEGALKTREAARIPATGFETEYLLHGPVALLDERDALVLLDDGGPAAERVASIATAAERTGAAVHRIGAPGLAQPLGVFPLTASVQRIALELAEQLGVNPDSFGFDDPQRWAAFEEIWPEL
jgi:glucosamine--fructose-6-phosphate aminotransferase (isomerizing)